MLHHDDNDGETVRENDRRNHEEEEDYENVAHTANTENCFTLHAAIQRVSRSHDSSVSLYQIVLLSKAFPISPALS
jgi:hypothetical protein